MSFRIQFMTALVYCTSNNVPKNQTKKLSHVVCGKLKAGGKWYVDRLGQHIKSTPQYMTIKANMENATFVPIPRSALLKPQTTWPAKIIADQFIEIGLGYETRDMLERRVAVPKSSNFRNANDRTSVDTLYDSLTVHHEMLTTERIILIDDVFTLGRAVTSCAKKLKDIYPDVEIQSFSAMRTRGGLSTFSKYT